MTGPDDNDRERDKKKILVGVLLGLLAVSIFVITFIARLRQG